MTYPFLWPFRRLQHMDEKGSLGIVCVCVCVHACLYVCLDILSPYGKNYI